MIRLSYSKFPKLDINLPNCCGEVHKQFFREYDFSLIGLRCVVEEVPIAVCRRCEQQFISGNLITAVTDIVATMIIKPSYTALTRQEARFLRKRAKLTVKEFADQLQLDVTLVQTWEWSDKYLSTTDSNVVKKFIRLLELKKSRIALRDKVKQHYEKLQNHILHQKETLAKSEALLTKVSTQLQELNSKLGE